MNPTPVLTLLARTAAAMDDRGIVGQPVRVHYANLSSLDGVVVGLRLTSDVPGAWVRFGDDADDPGVFVPWHRIEPMPPKSVRVRP